MHYYNYYLIMEKGLNNLLCILCGKQAKYKVIYENCECSDITLNNIKPIGVFCSEQCNEKYWNICTELDEQSSSNTSNISSAIENDIKMPYNNSSKLYSNSSLTPTRINLNFHVLSKDELGRASWKLLHSIPNRYPESNPSQVEKTEMYNFLKLFGKLYPCKMCSDHFITMFNATPPESYLKNRKSLRLTICRWHNMVNNRLKKPILPCTNILPQLSLIKCDENIL